MVNPDRHMVGTGAPNERPWPTPFVEILCPRCDVPVRCPRDVFDTLAVRDDDRNAVLHAANEKLRTELEAATRRANDYHRRAQTMAAALARGMDAGASDRSFGRALANAGHAAQLTLREAAEARLAVYRARYDDDLTPDEGQAAFDLEQASGHPLTWVQRDRVCREIRARRAP